MDLATFALIINFTAGPMAPGGIVLNGNLNYEDCADIAYHMADYIAPGAELFCVPAYDA